MNDFTEDNLAQKTLVDYLEYELGWESVFAFNTETFGEDGSLGRSSDSEVILTRYLREALVNLNQGLPGDAYDRALHQITEIFASQSLIANNKEKYHLIRDGVLVSYEEGGEHKKKRLRVFDFDSSENNHFMCVREMWITGPSSHRRRPDVMGFVNGLPLLFVELKRPDKSLRRAYEDNFKDYLDTIPHVFDFNAFVVLGNGIDAKMGSITAGYEHFKEWKRLSEEEEGVVDMETLVRGICTKANFLDLFENFILFDDSPGFTIKAVGRNHQYLGVNRAFESVINRKKRDGKLGVFWHTQGSGKSYSMVMFAQKVRRKLGGNFTFLVLTDRTDLDNQIYNTFAGTGLANHDKDPCRAGSGAMLKSLLSQQKAVVFSLVHKFNQKIEGEPYSDRDDIIVMTDEAHRSQYGTLALNMRDALPNANFIGFTGTPLFGSDEITSRVFGGYISTYGFQRAIEDQATVPLYYDARGDKLGISLDGINEKIAEKIAEAEIEDADVSAKLEKEMKREYHIVTADARLEDIARDFVSHYTTNWQTGKAMYVAIDKVTTVRMYDLISKYWQQHIDELEKELISASGADDRHAQLAWMKETKIAPVFSDEQGEVEKFRKWKLDVLPHRKLMKDGFVLEDGRRVDVETAFKKEDHPFRVVIVCAMWLTGFDVPSLATLYLDKPLQAHTLMQAIARANRVKGGKNNGLIVDYCGILKNLRKALATFAGHTGSAPIDGGGEVEVDPLHPEDELLAELQETVILVRDHLKANGFELDDLLNSTGFSRNKEIVNAKEAINTDDETRKRFEVSARAVFRKYKSCLTFEGVKAYRTEVEAISFIYKTLEADREKADISDIMLELNKIVSAAVNVNADKDSDDMIFDISKINFDLLRKEFEKSESRNSNVQSVKDAIETRLSRMLQVNPLRSDYQEKFDEIVRGYNKEKDKNTIEATFEALMRFTAEMSEEEHRHVKEGLDNEEQLAVYDMLLKPDITKKDIKKIKRVAVNLLQELERQMREIQDLFAKHTTRQQFKTTIYDFLYDDRTGLPEEAYDEEDLNNMSGLIFGYFENKVRVEARTP